VGWSRENVAYLYDVFSNFVLLNFISYSDVIRCSVAIWWPYMAHDDLVWLKVKVKLSLSQALKAHRVVRGQGSHILSRQSAHRWW
jgi:hypothetical protein